MTTKDTPRGYSQVQCEIALLEAAERGKHDYYHLRRGADLPLKSNEEIALLFMENKNKEFISIDKVSNENRTFTDRCDKWHFGVTYSGRNVFVKTIYWGCNALLKAFETFFNRFFPNRSKKFDSIIFMKGSTWFDIIHALAEYVLKHEMLIRKVFRYT